MYARGFEPVHLHRGKFDSQALKPTTPPHTALTLGFARSKLNFKLTSQCERRPEKGPGQSLRNGLKQDWLNEPAKKGEKSNETHS